MGTKIIDYIKALNELSEELLRSHAHLLAGKNIRRKRELIQLIKLDLDKLTHALLEVRENSAFSVLGDFFENSTVDAGNVHGKLAEPYIYHVGFEIHEPLDLVLYGINHWIERSKYVLGADMRVSGFTRFPASQQFQRRVGAYTEIMRIWLQVNERTLMLELFDIQRPADAMLAAAPKLTHRNFNGLFRPEDSTPTHKESLGRLFAGDEIWHYALFVKQPSDVVSLHAELEALAAGNSEYALPYAAPVHNQNDDSFHTKVIHNVQPDGPRLELEFVTQYAAVGASA
jgi:hypothetical protein